MSETSGGPQALHPLQILQLITGALIVGLLVFAGVAVFLGQEGGPVEEQPAESTLTYVLLLLALADLAVWTVLPARVAQGQVSRIAAGAWRPPAAMVPGARPPGTDAEKLLSVFQAKTILANGLLEALGFFAGVVYMIEGRTLALGVLALVVGLMVVSFPTSERAKHWVEPHLAQLRRQRELGGAAPSS